MRQQRRLGGGGSTERGGVEQGDGLPHEPERKVREERGCQVAERAA